jgi:hypothetical protein
MLYGYKHSGLIGAFISYEENEVLGIYQLNSDASGIGGKFGKKKTAQNVFTTLHCIHNL